MSGVPFGEEPHDRALLLGNLDRVDALADHREGEAAELADRVTHVREQVRVLLDQEAGAEGPAPLLVAQHAEHDVAGRRRTLGRPQHRGHEHRHATLHVQGAATPEDAVADLAGEGVGRPLLAGHRDHVDVTVEEQRRSRATPGQAGDDVGPVGIAGENPYLQPRGLQLGRQPGDQLTLPTGGRARVEADQLAGKLARLRNLHA